MAWAFHAEVTDVRAHLHMLQMIAEAETIILLKADGPQNLSVAVRCSTGTCSLDSQAACLKGQEPSLNFCLGLLGSIWPCTQVVAPSAAQMAWRLSTCSKPVCRPHAKDR